MAQSDLARRRNRFGTLGDRPWTAGAEHATRGWRRWAGDFAAKHDRAALRAGIESCDGRQQRLGVRVLRRLVPNDYRTDFDQIWRRIRKMLYAYMRGQLIIAALIGILSGIACAVLGLPDAIALGLLAGITALIPYLGPFIGAAVFVVVKQALSLITDGYNLFFGIFFMLVVAFFRGGILGTLRTLIGKWR